MCRIPLFFRFSDIKKTRKKLFLLLFLLSATMLSAQTGKVDALLH